MTDKPKVLAYMILRLGVSAHLIAFGLGRLFVTFVGQAPETGEAVTGIVSSMLLPFAALVIGILLLSGIMYGTAILGAALLGVVSILDVSFEGHWNAATPSLIFLLCVFHLMYMIEHNPGIDRKRRGSRRGHHGPSGSSAREPSQTPEV